MNFEDFQLGRMIQKNSFCCLCQQNFVIQDFSNLCSMKCPYMLRCGHTVCKLCLRSRTSIVCGICQQLSITDETLENTHLNPHLYLLGSLAYGGHQRRSDDRKSNRRSQANIADAEHACVECGKSASVLCQQCQFQAFCLCCWQSVHSRVKALMLHEKTSVAMADVCISLCTEHKQALDLYCIACNLTICSYCSVSQHQNHKLTTLAEQNENIKESVMSSANDIKEAIQYMQSTLSEIRKKRTKCFGTVNKNATKNIESAVNLLFTTIIGQLQLLHEELLKKIVMYNNGPKAELESLESELINYVEKGKRLEVALNYLTENGHGAINLSGLKLNIDKFLELPAFFVHEDTLDGSIDNIKLDCDIDLFDKISKSVSLHLPERLKLQLTQKKDLPENFQFPKLTDQNNSLLSLDDVFSSMSTLNLSEAKSETSDDDCNASGHKSLKALQKVQRTSKVHTSRDDDFVVGTTHKVAVTYLRSPDEFYVQRLKDQSNLNFLEHKIEQDLKAGIVPNEIKLNNVYICQYVDGKWYRGQVVEILDNLRLRVYYIDYGNYHVINRETCKLHTTTFQVNSMRPLAKKCKLHGCYPVNGIWTKESNEAFQILLKEMKPPCKITILGKNEDAIDVDVQFDRCDSFGGEIVSLRDYLVYLGYAYLTQESHNVINLPSPIQMGKYLYYPEQALPAPGEDLVVWIKIIISPSIFFVRKVSDDYKFHEITEDMNALYREKAEDAIVHQPYIEMPCAVFYKNSWYRAKLKAIKLQRMVKVVLVDTGEQVLLHADNIKRLTAKLLNIPPMMIRCSLAYINKWHENVKSDMKSLLVEETACKITVVEVQKFSVKVLLFNSTLTNAICVNRQLVNLNSATADPEINALNVRDAEKKMPHRVKNKRVKDEPVALDTSAYENDYDVSDDINWNKNGPSRSAVIVHHIESPSLIYLSLAMSNLKKMRDDLRIFYNSAAIKDDDCLELTEKIMVAAFIEKRKEWVRGRVMEILPNGNIKLELVDYGGYESVAVSAIRRLDEQFLSKRCMALKCRLGGVKPGCENWSSLACDLVRDEVSEDAEVYMSIMKSSDKSSDVMTVELWARKCEIKNVFGAKSIMDFSVNKMLVEQGVAFPCKDNEEYFGDIDLNPVDVERKVINFKKGTYETNNNVSDNVETLEALPETKIASLGSDWPPAPELTETSFRAYVYNIDDNGFISFCTEKDYPKLIDIQKTLGRIFKNSKPEPTDQFWRVNQLCIVRWEVEQTWHRGKVLTINEGATYDVLFVDYGNVETVISQDMRKRICFTDTPVLSHKCYVADMIPLSGKEYAVKDLNKIHQIIVEKDININLVQLGKEPLPAYLYRNDLNEDVLELLIHNKIASSKNIANNELLPIIEEKESKKIKSSKSSVPSVLLSNPNLLLWDFKRLELATPSCPIRVTIGSIDENVLVLVPLDDPSLPKQIRDAIAKLDDIKLEIEEALPSLDTLSNFDYLRCCVAERSANKKYCRAFIKSLTVYGEIVVQFIDYGDTEAIPFENVRTCKANWMDEPSIGIRVILNNLDVASYKEQLLQLREQRLYMKIIEAIKSDKVDYCVELLTEPEGPIAYQFLLDNGLLNDYDSE